MKKFMLIIVAFLLFGFVAKAQNTIFVSNLPATMNSEDLRDLFSQYGAVSSAKIITDRETRRSKGFGYVEMMEKESVTIAINELNGKKHNGRVLNVEIAKPKNPKR